MKNLLTLFLLATLFTSCEDFLSGPLLDQNPNEVDDVSIVSPEALLVGSQVTMYGVMEGYLNRAVSMVMQQMSGFKRIIIEIITASRLMLIQTVDGQQFMVLVG